MEIITGGVTAAKGFQAAATAAGIKYQDRMDMAMIVSEAPAAVAGAFTTNVVQAAPVKWDKKIVAGEGPARAVVVNAGIANACTGEEGMGYCQKTAEAVEGSLGIPAGQVLVASTGVIGMQLPMEKLAAGIRDVRQLPGRKKKAAGSGFEASYDITGFEQQGFTLPEA